MTATPTLVQIIWPAARRSGVRIALLAVAGVAVLTVSAKVQVPFWPVPMTLQTAATLLLAAIYGPILGPVTVGLYLLAGALGLPVFAGTPERGIGVAYMLGPTGGYLGGFLAASVLVGWLAARGWGQSLFSTALGMTLGTALLMGCGWLWLAVTLGGEQALMVGIVPFLPAEAVKIALSTCLLPSAWALLRRFGRA